MSNNTLNSILMVIVVLLLHVSCRQKGTIQDGEGNPTDSLKAVISRLQKKENKLDSLLILQSSVGSSTTNYAQEISGRFIMKGASCAGFNFINDHQVLWTNESACFDPDSLKIRWLDGITFMTVATKRFNQDCPPGVDVYKVISFNGHKLRLSVIWTGWYDSADDVIELNPDTK